MGGLTVQVRTSWRVLLINLGLGLSNGGFCVVHGSKQICRCCDCRRNVWVDVAVTSAGRAVAKTSPTRYFSRTITTIHVAISTAHYTRIHHLDDSTITPRLNQSHTKANMDSAKYVGGRGKMVRTQRKADSLVGSPSSSSKSPECSAAPVRARRHARPNDTRGHV